MIPILSKFTHRLRALKKVYRPKQRVLLACLLMQFLISCKSPPSAPLPLQFVVNSTLDAIDASSGDGICETNTSGECTLRAAIMEVNVSGGSSGSVSIITFSVDGQFTLSLTGAREDAALTGDLDILENVQIIGLSSATTILDGNKTDRVFHIDPAGLGITVDIRDLTIMGGNAGEGGGLLNHGNLELNNVTIQDNFAAAAGGLKNRSSASAILNSVSVLNNVATKVDGGGGVFNEAGAEMIMTGSYINNNRAETLGAGIINYGLLHMESTEISNNNYPYEGGGLYNGGTTMAIDLIIRGNEASSGGGIFNSMVAKLTLERVSIISNSSLQGGGGIRNSGQLNLSNVTISGNESNRPSTGGIFNSRDGTANLLNVTVYANKGSSGISNAGSFTLMNSIIADSQSGINCSGTITSQGHNLDSGNSCGLAVPGDMSNINPLLQPLANNGGFTQTHALWSQIPLSSFPSWRTQAGISLLLTPSATNIPNSSSLNFSPAINTADNSACPATDQRGVPRPQGADCDIGAHEYP